jgi:transcription antitermination factor NusG
MPILATEPNIFPENLFDSSEFDPFFGLHDSQWWAFYTRARQEKSLARDLLQREIAFYLPLVRRRLLIRGRAVHSHVPLFTGYLFVVGSDEDRVRALMTNRVAQVIPVGDVAQLKSDLQNIQMLIERGAPLTIESRLEPGQQVRIRSGPMAGLEGTVCKRKNQSRLIVWVNMLQQGVSLEIEDYLLDPIS